MFGQTNRIKSERGFSLAEVVIALALFVSSILGISVMLVNGGHNVTVGARESVASNLAQKKIEEVKSLPFYIPWSGTPADVDDTYWAYASGLPLGNNQQLLHPKEEPYGSIPGYGSFRRTTAVVYQYVNASSLAEASMDTSWTPKAPTSSQIDRPTGGPVGGPYDTLHGLMIQVTVFYRIDTGAEKSYVAQGLAGDLMVTGSTNAPPLVINNITPTTGSIGSDTNFQMTITVTTQPGTLNAGSQLDVYLWHAGWTDVHAKTSPAPVANAAGTQITCFFSLTQANGVRVTPINDGYNIAVYWQDEGWLATLRNGPFHVIAAAPQLTSIANFNWGHRGQSGRQITVTGQDLWSPTSVTLTGPNPANTYVMNGTINSCDGTTLVVTFDLTGLAAQRPANSRWNIAITTAGGSATSDTDAKRLWMNPPPQITAVTATSDPSYYNWTYRAQTARKVRIEGNYLYGLDTGMTAETNAKLAYGGWQTTIASATFQSGPTGNGCVSNTPVVMQFNPSSAAADSSTNDTRWNVSIMNYGCSGTPVVSDTDAKRVRMNPPPQLSNVSNWPGTPYTGTKNSNIYSNLGVSGAYFQTGVLQAAIIRDASPVATTTYANLNGGSLTTDGATINSNSINVNVNPMSNSFKLWGAGFGASAQSDNTLISGNYYTYLKNPDGQYAISSFTRAINHAKYLVAADVTPAGWGSMGYSPAEDADGYYQDTAYTLTPTYAMPYAVRYWQEPVGTDSPGLGYGNVTGTATAPRTLRCRSLKYLYYGPNGTSGNYAGFHQGYAFSDGTGAGYDAPNYQYGDGSDSPGYPWPNSTYVMRVHSWGKVNTFNSSDAEVDSETGALYNCAGATKLFIRWKQPNGNGDGSNSNSGFAASGTHNGRYNNGRVLGGDDIQFDWRWESVNCTGWNPYIRVGAYSDAVWPCSSPDTDVRVSLMFITNE